MFIININKYFIIINIKIQMFILCEIIKIFIEKQKKILSNRKKSYLKKLFFLRKRKRTSCTVTK